VNTLARPSLQQLALKGWRRVGTRFLPFADAASADLPLSRLLRLSLFQVSVGMALVLLNGTLNRVMIVELGVSASLVALMVALPIVFAPLRAFVGFRSDHHRSALGWRRVPYLWFGSMALFGGLAILPFALLVLTGEGHGPAWIGQLGAALAFLLVGAGLHTVQTAGLALATDLAPAETRPRVVALLYVTLLLGMVLSAGLFSLLLTPFSHLKLVQVIQGAALVAVVFNAVALWKQEARDPKAAARRAEQPQLPFRAAWRQFIARRHARRLLVAVGLGSAAFSMQDILLEPYGGQILRLGVGATTVLTALMAGGSLLAFALAARALQRGADAMRLAASGVLVGVLAFAMVIFAEPLQSAWLLRAGAVLIGFGGGLFSVATLTVAMGLDTRVGWQRRRSRQRPGTGRLGRGAGHRGRSGHRLRRRPARRRVHAGGAGCAGPGTRITGRRLQLCVPPGDRVAVCHAGGPGAPGANHRAVQQPPRRPLRPGRVSRMRRTKAPPPVHARRRPCP
jgi:BCD family chlorophyll transporter-like MFS transporter